MRVMSIFNHSFYAKLSAIFLVLMLAVGSAISYISVQSSLKFTDETRQKVNQDLAREMAVEFQPYLYEGINQDSIKSKIQYLNGINPSIDIYLLGGNGMIKGYFLGNETQGLELARQTVDTKPLDRFLNGEPFPILGPDPLYANRAKTFSVAPIQIMDETGCYLYIILSGKNYESAAGMISESYILSNSILLLGLIIAAAIVIGLIIFRYLTKRIRRMNKTVTAFERGEVDRRINVDSEDEIGQLASSFNKMADTLVANMKEIKKVDRLRRDLIANVSHDLRSPLASIQGYLETIQMKEGKMDGDERDRYYDIVLKNTQRLSTLVGELFELSRLDAKEVEPDFEAVSIPELVQDIVMQFKPQAEDQGVQLSAVIENESIPMVNADIRLMERVLCNLIDNAIKNTPVSGNVTVLVGSKEGHVQIGVSDTGKGIPQQDLPHIFDRFYQVDKSRSNSMGGGLGLSIAQKILQLHDTSLQVESTYKKGTRFSFNLQAI